MMPKKSGARTNDRDYIKTCSVCNVDEVKSQEHL